MEIFTATAGDRPLAAFNAESASVARDFAQFSDMRISLFAQKVNGERLLASGQEIDVRPATAEESARFWEGARAGGIPEDEDDHIVVVLAGVDPQGPLRVKPA